MNLQTALKFRSLSRILHRLHGTGLPRISEYLRSRYQQRWPPGLIEIPDFRGNLRFCVDPTEHMGSRIFWFDAYSEIEIALIECLLKAGDVFIDIGANQGEFSLVAASLVGESGKVIAIEPVPEIIGRLRHNIEINQFQPIITVIEAAIGSEEGWIQLFGPDKSASEVHAGLPTAFRSPERSAPITRARQTSLDALLDEIKPQTVTGIKLDIEGGELAALQGAIETIRTHKPWMIFEVGVDTCNYAGYDPMDIIEMIESLGYELKKITHEGLKKIISRDDIGNWQNIIAEHYN